MNVRETNEHSLTVVLPVRYRLIDKDGASWGQYSTAQEAAEFARGFWPGQEQDPDRTGKGWDVECVR